MFYEPISLTMMMLGPSRIGKTTLLATMYNELQKLHAQAGFDFLAEDATSQDMHEAYNHLQRITQQKVNFAHEPLLKGTTGIQKRTFSVLFEGEKEFDVSFYDYEGAFVDKRSSEYDPKDINEFKAHLQEAIVIMNIIDGAALVEGSEFYNNRTNCPSLIADLLTKAINDNQQHLLLFVITKCEKWLKNNEERKKLIDAFDTRHKKVLNVISKNSRNNVLAVLMPVKTLGCVEFSRIKNFDIPEQEETVFVRKPGMAFQPELVEQPLRYALSFALSQSYIGRPWLKTIIEKINGREKRFLEALKQFSENRNKIDFITYGNINLLP